MSHQSTESKPLLSYVIAEWACGLKYEHLSPEAIQAAKLFWFDSIGCALGGSQQDDARILLKHHRAMGGGHGKATAFVSGYADTDSHAAPFVDTTTNAYPKTNANSEISSQPSATSGSPASVIRFKAVSRRRDIVPPCE